MAVAAVENLPGYVADDSADISDGNFNSFIFAVNFVFDFVIGCMGIVFNVINAVTFTRMGLSDTTNICLLGLAVADIGVSVMLVIYSVVYSPMVLDVAPVELITAITYATLGSWHVMFARIAGCLTAYITLVRFLCVAFPLHVRAIVTPERTFCAVALIYVILMVCNIPFQVANQIGPRFDLTTNKTVYGLVVVLYSTTLEDFTLTVDTAAQMTSFAVVFLSTMGLIRSLDKVSKWRSSASLVKSSSLDMKSREKQLVKMTFLIASVFIVCSLPTVTGNLVMLFVKDFHIQGRYKNIFHLMIIIFFALDSINSSINIFIYYKMSSKFKENFISLC